MTIVSIKEKRDKRIFNFFRLDDFVSGTLVAESHTRAYGIIRNFVEEEVSEDDATRLWAELQLDGAHVYADGS